MGVLDLTKLINMLFQNFLLGQRRFQWLRYLSNILHIQSVPAQQMVHHQERPLSKEVGNKKATPFKSLLSFTVTLRPYLLAATKLLLLFFFVDSILFYWFLSNSKQYRKDTQEEEPQNHLCKQNCLKNGVKSLKQIPFHSTVIQYVLSNWLPSFF